MPNLRAGVFLLLACSRAHGGGVADTACSDRDRSCANWARAGECSAANSQMVQRLCPSSCRVCQPGCQDASPHCYEWQQRGDVQNNSDFMRTNCSVSSGACLVVCRDQSTHCAAWAAEGLCAQRPALYNHLCPVACGVCHSRCVDLDESCPAWAAQGMCSSNAARLLPLCAHSCGVCVPSAAHAADDAGSYQLASVRCADDSELPCATWGATACSANPDGMVRHCPQTCGACTHVCVDAEDACEVWAASGECTGDASTVLAQRCPVSCGTCADLQQHLQLALEARKAA